MVVGYSELNVNQFYVAPIQGVIGFRRIYPAQSGTEDITTVSNFSRFRWRWGKMEKAIRRGYQHFGNMEYAQAEQTAREEIRELKTFPKSKKMNVPHYRYR